MPKSSPRFFKRFQLNRVLSWIAAGVSMLTLSSLLTGCGQTASTDATTYTSGTFNAVYNQTLKTACIECHNTSSSTYAAGVLLDFSTQGSAYSSLTSQYAKTPSNPSSTCKNNVHIVAAGAPASSYLVGVLNSAYNQNNFAGRSGCQPYTAHLTDQNLSAAEQTSIITWIQQGAANN